MTEKIDKVLFPSLEERSKAASELPVRLSTNISMPDGERSLLSLAEDFISGKITPPLHQRSKDAWPQAKKREWINRCRDVLSGKAERPLGAICLYRLRDDPYQIYLNEGLQRISAAAEALSIPASYGRDREDIRTILEVTHIHVQNRIYDSHTKAVDDFVAVNNGVGLEPAERHRHILVYAEGWRHLWSEQIDLWREKIQASLSGYCNSTDRRKANLSAFRADLQLFAVAHIGRPMQFGHDDQLEKIVVEVFNNSNPDLVKKHIKQLQDFSAEIETAWRKEFINPSVTMQASLAKWCLGVRFLHDKDISLSWWQTFFTRLFARTGGNASITHKNLDTKKEHHYNLTTKLNQFRKVCQIVELDSPIRPTRTRGRKLKAGYHNDHILPLSDYGDGKTQPMPARLNAAKNARIIREE